MASHHPIQYPLTRKGKCTTRHGHIVRYEVHPTTNHLLIVLINGYPADPDEWGDQWTEIYNDVRSHADRTEGDHP